MSIYVLTVLVKQKGHHPAGNQQLLYCIMHAVKETECPCELWRKHIKRVEDTNKVFKKEVRISFDEFADLDVVECTSRERSQDKKK